MEWPADPGPAGGYEDGSGAGGNTPPPSGDQGVTPGAPAPAPDGQSTGADPNAAPAPTNFRELPEYRREQIAARQQAQENARLKSVIAALATGQPVPGQTPDQPVDPRREKLRNTILELMPELKELQNLTAAQQANAAAEEERVNRFATKQIGLALDHAASELLGAGKKAKDLNKAQTTWLKDAFITFVTSDPDRTARFDAGEVDGMHVEFWNEFNQGFRANAVRQQQTTVLERGQRRANLPTQGASSAPVGTPPTPINLNDDAAVHKAAWAAASGGR
jgi:hypothetical protein